MIANNFNASYNLPYLSTLLLLPNEKEPLDNGPCNKSSLPYNKDTVKNVHNFPAKALALMLTQHTVKWIGELRSRPNFTQSFKVCLSSL